MTQVPLRLQQQFAFILEVEKLKRVIRQSYHLDGSHKENDAEHAWHFAMMAMTLQEYANEPVDIARVVQMALVHDLVEIDAGDTFCYDEIGAVTKAQRETKAADRIFALLPEEQARRFRGLWEEFEARQTADAKFAAALDRLEPMMLNYHTQGRAWREHGVTVDKVIARNQHIAEGSPQLWEYAQTIIEGAVAKGYLRDSTSSQ